MMAWVIKNLKSHLFIKLTDGKEIHLIPEGAINLDKLGYSRQFLESCPTLMKCIKDNLVIEHCKDSVEVVASQPPPIIKDDSEVKQKLDAILSTLSNLPQPQVSQPVVQQVQQPGFSLSDMQNLANMVANLISINGPEGKIKVKDNKLSQDEINLHIKHVEQMVEQVSGGKEKLDISTSTVKNVDSDVDELEKLLDLGRK